MCVYRKIVLNMLKVFLEDLKSVLTKIWQVLKEKCENYDTLFQKNVLESAIFSNDHLVFSYSSHEVCKILLNISQ